MLCSSDPFGRDIKVNRLASLRKVALHLRALQFHNTPNESLVYTAGDYRDSSCTTYTPNPFFDDAHVPRLPVRKSTTKHLEFVHKQQNEVCRFSVYSLYKSDPFRVDAMVSKADASGVVPRNIVVLD
jgi:hypothetical protein